MRMILAVSALGILMSSASLAYAGEGSSAPSVDPQTCQQHQTTNTVAGAAVGAVAGAIVGNNVAARGHHGAGSALGAVVGGVAGGTIGHNTTNCDVANDTAQAGDYPSKADEPPPPPPVPTNYPPK